MATGTDDVLVRFGRWALVKIWFGVVVSGAYAIGLHYDWPQAFLTVAAVLGALALALASSFLPIWTRQRPSGILVADIGLRVMVWSGLIVAVIALLVGMPAVGMTAAALLLNIAAHTFGDPFVPFLRRLRITPTVRYPAPQSPQRSPSPPHPSRPAAFRSGRQAQRRRSESLPRPSRRAARVDDRPRRNPAPW